MELLALGRGQAVAAQTFIERCLLDPFPDRVGRGLELPRQLIDATPRARQLDDAAPVFGRIWWMCSWHGEPPLLFLPNTVHESGSTPRIVGALTECPTGASARIIAEKIGVVPNTVSNRLSKLKK